MMSMMVDLGAPTQTIGGRSSGVGGGTVIASRATIAAGCIAIECRRGRSWRRIGSDGALFRINVKLWPANRIMVDGGKRKLSKRGLLLLVMMMMLVGLSLVLLLLGTGIGVAVMLLGLRWLSPLRRAGGGSVGGLRGQWTIEVVDGR